VSEKFPGFKQREDMIQFAADIRAETMKILHEERDKDRALLERMVNHLTVPPRSTWRVVELAGDGTPHDVPIEFPAQVVYIDNGSTENVQVRAPGDIAQSPPIAASGQGRWLVPGATQVTVTGSGTGQVRLRFLNDAAARLLADNPPGGSTTSPAYVSLTGGSIPAGSATIGAVNEQRYNGSAWEDVYNNTQGTLLASAARTSTTSSPTQTNTNASGVIVILNVSVITGTVTNGLEMFVIIEDPISGTTFGVNNPTAVKAVGEYRIYVGPDAGAGTAPSNISELVGIALPRTWSISVNDGDTSATSYTYSVSYQYVGT
jgi:hypothetical protein